MGQTSIIPPQTEDISTLDLDKKKPRAAKNNFKCGHHERKHYAKGMCCNCYHKKGREKLAWGCEHKDKAHYAKGLC